MIDGAEIGADLLDGFSPIKAGEGVGIEGGHKAGLILGQLAASHILTGGEVFSGLCEVIVFYLAVYGGEKGRERLKKTDIAADMVGR